MSSLGRGLTQFSQGIQPGILALLQAAAQKQQQGQGVDFVKALLAGQGGATPGAGAGPSPSPTGAPPAPMGGAPSPVPPAAPPVAAGGAPRPQLSGPAPAPAMGGATPAPMAGAAPTPLSLASGGQSPVAAGGPAPQQSDQNGLIDPWLAAQSTIAKMAQSIKAANPGITDKNLLGALQQGITMMKGVAPETKAAATNQVAMLRAQWGHEDRQDAEQGRDSRAANSQAGMDRRQGVAEAGKDSRQAAGDATRIKVAGIGAKARLDSAGIAAAARNYATDKGFEKSEDAIQAAGQKAQLEAFTKQVSGLTGDAARVYSSVSNSGATAEQALAAAQQFEKDHGGQGVTDGGPLASGGGGAKPSQARYRAPAPSQGGPSKQNQAAIAAIKAAYAKGPKTPEAYAKAKADLAKYGVTG